ncbi:MAG: sugar phosphate isomerase/epimerase family protein [Thermoguttaceae bacterium]|jgi:sugar phosphate isomerase/epimerase
MFKNFNPSFLGLSGHQSEVIELALTYGFAGMDLNIADFATRVRLKGLPYARRLIDSARIRVGTFQLPIDCDTDEETFHKDLKKLQEYADAAAAVGCTRCIFTLPPAGDKRPYHENFEFLRRRFQEIAAVFKTADINLALGFQAAEYLRRNQAFQFIHDIDALTLLLNMIDSPNVGLLLDVWEIFACGGSLESIRKIPKHQIVAVQIAEISAQTPLAELDEKSRLLPDAQNGRIGVPSILSYLAEIGYDGPVTVKPCRAVFPSRRRDTIVKLTSESLDKVWREAGLPTPARAFVAGARE